MNYRPLAVIVLLAAVTGLLFAGVSTYDAMAHLDRQVHGIHCSYIPGMGTEDATGKSGCYATLMSPYSSFLRHAVWGGIPVALPGMAVFAFLAFFVVWLYIGNRFDDRRATLFLLLATLVPLLTSLVMAYLAIVTLDVVCKTCAGIYGASIVAFVGALLIFLRSRRTPSTPDAAPAVAWSHLALFFILGIVFVLLPVVTYAAAAPDFSRYIGSCGTLPYAEDSEHVMVAVGPKDRKIKMIEVMDPLCAACGVFEQRFLAMPESARLSRKLLLFPLDNTCNWMVDEAIHPGACAVSEAVLCGEDLADEVLHFAVRERERIIAASKTDPKAAARIMATQFPWLKKCLGSAAVRARLNLALRFAVKNQLQVLTPQIYIGGHRLCDEDTDLGLEYALSRLIDKAQVMKVPSRPPPAAPILPPGAREERRPRRPRPAESATTGKTPITPNTAADTAPGPETKPLSAPPGSAGTSDTPTGIDTAPHAAPANPKPTGDTAVTPPAAEQTGPAAVSNPRAATTPGGSLAPLPSQSPPSGSLSPAPAAEPKTPPETTEEVAP